MRKGWTPSSRPGPAAGRSRAHPAPTARRFVEASISPNTRRAYSGALRRLDAWFDGRPLKDATLAAYLGELHDHRRAPSEHLDGGLAAARFRASLAGEPAIEGGGKRGRSGRRTSPQVLATCRQPQPQPPRPLAASPTTSRSARLDAVIAVGFFLHGRDADGAR